MTTARRAESTPADSEYPCEYGSAWIMSRMITSGASKPNSAGLPMFSFMIRWPSASSRAACACTGPRIS
ncbi:Uncharacterised protein [Mycobacteroides abscessus subsp. abscessus]|nr:Uncharacterised protein [Mycobacteroides abscessus subsp. abscessus]